jgi:hypothetical protein
MNLKFQATPSSHKWHVALHILLVITVINYIAQIPYYIHFYAVHHVYPSTFGIAFLLVTFAIFLAGYFLTLQAKPIGSWLLLIFLVMEFGGYLLHNLTGAFLRDIPLNDLLFLTVSLIGYLNFAVSFIYLLIILTNRQLFFQAQHIQ